MILEDFHFLPNKLKSIKIEKCNPTKGTYIFLPTLAYAEDEYTTTQKTNLKDKNGNILQELQDYQLPMKYKMVYLMFWTFGICIIYKKCDLEKLINEGVK